MVHNPLALKICAIYFLTSFHIAPTPVSSCHIVFFHTSATASHRTAIWPLAEKLADSGHNVTYVFPTSKRMGSHPKIEEIHPSYAIKLVDRFAGDFDINIRLNNTQNEWLQNIFLKVVHFCEAFYTSPEVIYWLARPGLKIDLIMIDGALGQCAYGLVHKFKAKHVLFNPTTINMLFEEFGIVPESSSLPEIMFHRKPGQMSRSLWDRTLTTIAPFIWRYMFLDTLHGMERVARKRLNISEGEMPSFEEIEEGTSLVLHNSYFIDDYSMNLPPFFVSYSGLSCGKNEMQKRKPLPKNLESFLNDKNSDGFVYVSFGSAVVISAMPDQLRQQFLEAFAAFPRLKFLWRWTGPVPEDSPKNVMFQDWFPQLDVLSDSRIKAFITQGGRPSTQEAICSDVGVPMIIIPVFGDQDYNADRLEYVGAAINLDITSITTKFLVNAIREVVEKKEYKNRLRQLSAMFRDRPVDPLENAFFWVEYVLRHNDTSLMKPLARKQTWWQRRLFDVYAFIFVMTTALIAVIIKIGILVLKRLMWMLRIRRNCLGVMRDSGNKLKSG